MAKILIVDDEEAIREVVKEYCELNGYDTDEAVDGVEAIECVNKNIYDCIVLDIMMPNLDGFSAIKVIKKISKTPVIMLSARQDEEDKLLCFELGVDDYVAKPFSPKELMARINVILERNKSVSDELLVFGDLVIDQLGRTVTIKDQKVALTPKEYDLLLYMAQNPNIALSRAVLLDKVWNYDYFGDERTVDTHIKMLRHNLKGYRDCIVTVRGMGYKFET